MNPREGMAVAATAFCLTIALVGLTLAYLWYDMGVAQ